MKSMNSFHKPFGGGGAGGAGLGVSSVRICFSSSNISSSFAKVSPTFLFIRRQEVINFGLFVQGYNFPQVERILDSDIPYRCSCFPKETRAELVRHILSVWDKTLPQPTNHFLCHSLCQSLSQLITRSATLSFYTYLYLPTHTTHTHAERVCAYKGWREWKERRYSGKIFFCL